MQVHASGESKAPPPPGSKLFFLGGEAVWPLTSPLFLFPLFVRALGKPYIPDNDEARRVSLDYTLAAARAFTEQQQHAAAGDGRDSKFRFIYMSGKAVQRDQTKSLWFLSEYRKMRVRGGRTPPPPTPPTLVQRDEGKEVSP